MSNYNPQNIRTDAHGQSIQENTFILIWQVLSMLKFGANSLPPPTPFSNAAIILILANFNPQFDSDFGGPVITSLLNTDGALDNSTDTEI